MFDNAGRKLKGVLDVAFWIIVVLILIAVFSIFTITKDNSISAAVILLALMAITIIYVSMLLVAAIAEIAEDTQEIKAMIKIVESKMEVENVENRKIISSPSKKQAEYALLKAGGWKCPNCSTVNASYQTKCNCGQERP